MTFDKALIVGWSLLLLFNTCVLAYDLYDRYVMWKDRQSYWVVGSGSRIAPAVAGSAAGALIQPMASEGADTAKAAQKRSKR